MQAEVKDAYWAIFDTDGLKTPPGPRLAELIDARISEMAARYSATYPSAMKCLTTGKEGLTAYLRFPAEHHNRVRHSNFIVISSPAADVRDVADEQVSAPHLRSGRGYLWPVQHAASEGFGVCSAGGRERLAA
jgi:transposase-like protein